MTTRDMTPKLASLSRHIDDLFEDSYIEAADESHVREMLRAAASAIRRASIAEHAAVGNGGHARATPHRVDFDGAMRKLREAHREAAHERDVAKRRLEATQRSVTDLAVRALESDDPEVHKSALKQLRAQGRLLRVTEWVREIDETAENKEANQ